MRELPEMFSKDKDELGGVPKFTAHLSWKVDPEFKEALDMHVVFGQGYLVSRKVVISEEDAKKIEEILLAKYLAESIEEEVTAI